jgi:hypothetical protein
MATTWASSSRGNDCNEFDDDDNDDDGGNDNKFLHKIANYGPALSLMAVAAATAAMEKQQRWHSTKIEESPDILCPDGHCRHRK